MTLAYNAEEVLDEIQTELSGTEWSPETLEAIASIIRGTGRVVRDIESV